MENGKVGEEKDAVQHPRRYDAAACKGEGIGHAEVDDRISDRK